MVRCSVLGCRSDSDGYLNKGEKRPDISFHSFPDVINITDEWIKATGRMNWMPKKSSRICSLHFPKKHLVKKKRLTVLLPGTVPLLDCHTTRTTSHKPKKIKSLQDELRVMIARVYHYLQKEYEYLKNHNGNSCDLSPLANVLQRTAGATGVNQETVTMILEDQRRNHDSLAPVSLNKTVGKLDHSYIRPDYRTNAVENSCIVDDYNDDDSTDININQNNDDEHEQKVAAEMLMKCEVVLGEDPDEPLQGLCDAVAVLPTCAAKRSRVKTKSADKEDLLISSVAQHVISGAICTEVKIEPVDDDNHEEELCEQQNYCCNSDEPTMH